MDVVHLQQEAGTVHSFGDELARLGLVDVEGAGGSFAHGTGTFEVAGTGAGNVGDVEGGALRVEGALGVGEGAEVHALGQGVVFHTNITAEYKHVRGPWWSRPQR